MKIKIWEARQKQNISLSNKENRNKQGRIVELRKWLKNAGYFAARKDSNCPECFDFFPI